MAMSEQLRGLLTQLDIPGKLIAVDESLVFEVQGKTGPEAWHVYPSLNLDAIVRYQNLIQRVADCITNQPGVIQTMDGSMQYPFTWKVVTIDEVIMRAGRPVTVSKFIPGDTLSELLKKSNTAKGLHPLQQIEVYDPGIVDADLTEFSGKLNTTLRTMSVWIKPVNTKAINRDIVVTDVCTAVKNVALGFE